MTERLSEFDLIAKLFAPLARAPGAFGLTDDAAVVPPRPGCELAVTTDALVEGVHFLSSDPPDTIARKALRVNLSDLAAKGAEPAGYFLALSLPSHIGMDWLTAFAAGLAADGQDFAVSLLGGDTTATPGPLTLAITAMGYVPAGGMIRRFGARPGDGVYVSGTIGDAGAGLEILTGDGPRAAETAAWLIGRYRLPTPRLALGLALRGIATSALDVSDGLIADLGHIATVSGVRIVVDSARIPVSDALRAYRGLSDAAILKAVTGGDDYEIAFTAPPDIPLPMIGGVSLHRIGRVESGHGVVLTGAGGEIPVANAGYRHF